MALVVVVGRSAGRRAHCVVVVRVVGEEVTELPARSAAPRPHLPVACQRSKVLGPAAHLHHHLTSELALVAVDAGRSRRHGSVE